MRHCLAFIVFPRLSFYAMLGIFRKVLVGSGGFPGCSRRFQMILGGSGGCRGFRKVVEGGGRWWKVVESGGIFRDVRDHSGWGSCWWCGWTCG